MSEFTPVDGDRDRLPGRVKASGEAIDRVQRTPSDADQFYLVLPEPYYEALMEVLYPPSNHPHRELGERAAIAVVTRRTDERSVTYQVSEVVQPSLEDPSDGIRTVKLDDDGEVGYALAFGKLYRERAVERAVAATTDSGDTAGLLFVHTHPDPPGVERSARPSAADMASAREKLREYARRIRDCGDCGVPPMAAAVVTAESDGKHGARPRDGEWTVRAYQYDSTLEPTVTWADGVRVVDLAEDEFVADYGTDIGIGRD